MWTQNPEKAFVWGLLRDCEIFVYLWIIFGLVMIHIHTTAAQVTMMHWTQRSGSSDSSGGQHIEHIITNSITNTLPPVFLSRAWPVDHRWLDVASLNVSRCRWWLGLSIHYLCQYLVQSWPAQCNCWSRRLPNNYIDHWPTNHQDM